jgi:hypothetical protein
MTVLDLNLWILHFQYFLSDLKKHKKNQCDQASVRLVHKMCGQGVEKYVNNHGSKRQVNNFYLMPII